MKSKFLQLLLLIGLSTNIVAQVTTNGGSGLATSYPSLANAITALNSATISTPVIITLTANETAPSTGFVITASGTSANTISIQGGNNTVTAGTGYTAGAFTDAIFKILGADYVTIENFVMQENALNTTTAPNNMTEWGVALLYATTTNGAQNCTIQNNSITLSSTYPNTFGIYSNSTHSATNVITLASATTANGGNQGLKVYGNTINNARKAIVVVGPTAAADFLTGIDIGGNSAATGNSINNFGGSGLTAFRNVETFGVGIYMMNVKGSDLSHNTLTSKGGTTAPTDNFAGIYYSFFTAIPTGIYDVNITKNTIDMGNGTGACQIFGIYMPNANSVSTAASLNISCNNFIQLKHNVAATGGQTAIRSGAAAFNTTINGNTFTNLTSNTSSTFTFITANAVIPANGTTTVNNNSIVNGFTKTVSGGFVRVFVGGSTTETASVTHINKNNNFSNITLTGAGQIVGWDNQGNGNKIISGNTFNSWSGGNGAGSAIYGIWVGNSFNCEISGNTISNINTFAGAIIGILQQSQTRPSPNTVIKGNSIFGLKNNQTAGGTTVNEGIAIYAGTFIDTNIVVEKNIIRDIEHAGIGLLSTVTGIEIRGGTKVTVQNNVVGDLRVPIADNLTWNSGGSLRGIKISGLAGYERNIYHNSVYLNAVSTGTNLFFSSAIFMDTTSTVTLKNNILVNLSTPTASSKAVAIGRSAPSLRTYQTASDRNLLYAGTASATNVIYYDGTDDAQTLAAFQAKLADARDANSITENPTFLSTNTNFNFLRITPTVSTLLNGGADVIPGISDDIDGDTRTGTPDIGADEFLPSATACTPPTAVITPSGSTILCACSSITLTASGGTSYLWDNGATSATISVSSPGKYSVIVTNADGCKSTATQTVSITTTATTNSNTVNANDSYTWYVNGQTYTQSGTYTFSTDCVVETLVLTINITLPVALTDFFAKKQGMHVDLNWITTAEYNNKGFYIQRSANGSNFTNIHFEPAQGSLAGAAYLFTDKTPLKGLNFYRLQQMDNDNKTSFSQIRLINFNEKYSISMYPNPVKQQLTLALHGINGPVDLQLIDLQGRVLRKWSYPAGMYLYQLNMGELSAGLYTLMIRDAFGGVQLQSVIKE